MGRLRVDQDEFILPPTAIVGRAPGSEIGLSDESVSRAHALLAWNGAAWTVRDLASQNGTLLGGRRLEPGTAERVTLGTSLGFGDVDAILTDDAPPRAMAETDGEWLEAEGNVLWLEPAADLLGCVHFERGRWVFETSTGRSPVVDGESIAMGEARYRLRLPDSAAPTHRTRPAVTLADIRLEVQASADLETVRLIARLPDGDVDLGTRAHHTLVWLLAHRRNTDLDAGVLAEEAGWVDAPELPRLAATTENTLYTYIHRLRKQVEKLGLVDAPGVIERRLPGGQLRLGVSCTIRPLQSASTMNHR